ncbi:hypothetical protein [Lewinella sp. LCG006]|uniref:hypothetical protein n=1 Tax=Lewinella sp. LCG006 TaxID=3231911 RepID=UPI003460B8C7
MSEKSSKLIFISILAAICFNFPFLGLLGKLRLIMGIPQLYLMLFVIWLLIIIATYFTLRSSDK